MSDRSPAPPARRAFLGALASTALACGTERPPPGRVVVPFWFTYGGKNRTTVLELVRRFNVRQSDVFVKAVFQGDYFEGLAKLRTALAAGLAPPLSHVVGEVIPYLAAAGTLEALDQYPGARALDLLPELGQAAAFEGGASRPLYCVPFNRSTPIAYLNGEHLGPVGEAPPATWTELESLAHRLGSTEKPRRFGFACPLDWWFWAALVGQAGGDLVDGRGRVTLGGEAGARALELWQRLVASGAMKPPPGRDYNAWETQNQDFLAGRVAMMWSSTAFLRYLEDTASFPVVAAPLPAGVRRAVPSGGTFLVILRQTPAELKRAAFEFLKFLLEPESAAFWSSETGYLPVTRGAVEFLRSRQHFQKRPNFAVALEQLPAVRPWPWSESLFRWQREIVQPRLESAVLERKDARGVLEEARRLAERSDP